MFNKAVRIVERAVEKIDEILILCKAIAKKVDAETPTDESNPGPPTNGDDNGEES